MAIAKSTIPNTFLRTAIPPAPNRRSILPVSVKITNTTIIFKKTATAIFTASNSARRESMVVIEPAPAIMGKAKGTMEAVFAVEPSSLKRLTFNTISKAIINIITDPATAKELTSIPIKPINRSPKNKKPSIISKETTLALRARHGFGNGTTKVLLYE